MTTLYVDNIAPNLQSRVSVPGHVIQVVSSTLVTSVTLSSANTWTDIGLSVAITPSSTSSKILVITTVDTSAAGGDVITRLLRDSTVIGAGTSGSTYNGIAGQPSGSYSNMKVSASANYLDSPNTTSALTYKIQCVGNSANNGYVNRRSQNDFGGASYITLMEIAG